jgi:pimeloyl-ACP methyl ester carboxylesterase
MMGGEVWEPLVPALARTRRVLVPDLPGHGGTPLAGAWTFAGVREAIEAELLARGIGEVDVGGYSLGAYHALALALAERVRVGKLWLAGPVAGADADILAAFAAVAAPLRAGALDPAQFFLDLAAPPPWAAAHPAELAAVREAIARMPVATLAAELEAFRAMPDLRPRLAEVRAGTVLRAGTEDRNTPLAWAEAMARAIPGARLERVPGVGHLYLTQDRDGSVASALRALG